MHHTGVIGTTRTSTAQQQGEGTKSGFLPVTAAANFSRHPGRAGTDEPTNPGRATPFFSRRSGFLWTTRFTPRSRRRSASEFRAHRTSPGVLAATNIRPSGSRHFQHPFRHNILRHHAPTPRFSH